MFHQLSVDMLMQTYRDLKEHAVGFDEIGTNKLTVRKWVDEFMTKTTIENTGEFSYLSSFMGIKVIERECVPNGFAIISQGGKFVGFIDFNKGEVVRFNTL